MQSYFTKSRSKIFARSLKTRKKLVAISYSKILYKKLNFIKYNIEMDMDKELILRLVDDFTNLVFEDTQEDLYNTSNILDTPFYLTLEDNISSYQNCYSKNDFTPIQDEVDTIISKLSTIPSEEEIVFISKQLLSNHINNLKIIKSNIEKSIYKEPKLSLKPDLANTVIATDNEKYIKSQSYTLGKIFTQYRNHNQKNWTKDDVSLNDVVYHILKLFFTEYKSLLEINHKDLLDLVNVMYDIPNRVLCYAQDEVKDLDYILDHSYDIDTISIGTMNKYIVTINKFFKYCEKLNYIATPLRIDKITDKSISQARVAYDMDDLQLVANHIKTIDYDKALIIRIALYSGLRLGEITQLTKDDIKLDTEFNIFYFDINTLNGKKVKNKTSIRKVPLHPDICSDILDYISTLKSSDNLFNITSAEFSKWFRSKFNRKFITKDKKKVFHSFRHNAVTNMVQNNVPLEYIASVVGHAQDLGMTFHYAGNFLPLDKLKTAIFAIKYKNISFEHR